MGFSYYEAYNIPVWQRNWFIQRLNKEIKKSMEDNGSAQTRAAHTNDAQTRSYLGNNRAQVPAKLRRFT